MNIKTVLFLTVASTFGKYEDVHYSSDIDYYLRRAGNEFESLNEMCYFTIYTVIKTEVYKGKSIFRNDMTMEERKNQMYKYMVRLHRTYHINKHNSLNEIVADIWIFYKDFIDWIKEDTDNTAKVMKSVDKFMSNENFQILIKKIELSPEVYYNHCNKMLRLLSEPTEEGMENYLSQKFYNQGVGYEENIKNGNNEMELPASIKYGFILLLLKKEEIEKFMSLSDEHEQKIFVVNMIKEALINICFAIKKELEKFKDRSPRTDQKNHKFCTLYTLEQSCYIMKWRIIKSMFMIIIDATEAIYNIQGMEESYPSFINYYSTFMNVVKVKFLDLCPSLVKKCYWEDYSSYKENQEIIDLSPDRITINNSIRVPIIDQIISPNMQIDLDYILAKYSLENVDNRILFLLEVHGWILTIRKYAVLIRKDSGIQQNSITDLTTEFSIDRNFFE